MRRRLLATPRTPRPARSTARCPRRSRPAGSRSRCWRARRGAERGPLPPDRGRHAARLDVPSRCRRRRASSTAGPAIQAIEVIYHAVSQGDARRRAGVQRRRHLLARLVGHPGGHGRAWADGAPHPIGQGAHVHGDGANASCTSPRPPPASPRPRSGRPEPVADGAGRARPDSGGAGRTAAASASDGLPVLEDAWMTTCRAHEERSVGPGGRRGPAGQQRRAAPARRHAPDRQGHPAKVPKGARSS